MKSQTTIQPVAKKPQPLAWQVTSRRLPASPAAMSYGCSTSDCSGAPVRQLHAPVNAKV
jgi:hypothetical protein